MYIYNMWNPHSTYVDYVPHVADVLSLLPIIFWNVGVYIRQVGGAWHMPRVGILLPYANIVSIVYIS